jgi:hypothetical protein
MKTSRLEDRAARSSAAPLLGVALGLALLGGAGCAHHQPPHYGFRPTEMVSTQEGGFPASRYVVTPQAPRGEVYVTSFGTREVDEGAGSQLIHARMAVANQSGDGDWMIDPAQQLLVVPGGASQAPSFMEVDGRAGTTTAVPRGQKRVFDLYYRMPGVRDARDVAGFELRWQVATGQEVYAQQTPFVRQPYDDHLYGRRSHVAVGIGPPWWGYWYGPPWGYWGYYGWPYHYGYGPYAGFGVYGRSYYGGPRYYGGGPRYGGGSIGGGGMRVAPSVRGAPALRGRPGGR